MNKKSFLILFVIFQVIIANASITIQEAKEIALNEIKNVISVTTCGKWSNQTEITSLYPIYIDGISSVSYYECKAMTNGEDAGYVLVNLNQTDLIVTESKSDGITLFEKYCDIIGHNNIRVCRYDAIRSAALDNSNDDILTTDGFSIQNDQIQLKINKYRESVRQKGCNPYYSREQLDQYYNSDVIGLAKTKSTLTDVYSHELKNTFPSWGTKTVPWTQYKKNDGYYIGCGPVAWGIVYGYWKQFKNKNDLFEGISNLNGIYENNSIVKDCIDFIAKCVKTANVSDEQGLTYPWNMPDGELYGMIHGYNCLSNYCKSDAYDIIKNNLDKDKPVILLISSGNTWILPDHYVVAEKSIKYVKKVLGVSYVSSIRYYCNFGSGTKGYKWIYGLDRNICVDDVFGVITLDILNKSKVLFQTKNKIGDAPFHAIFNIIDVTNRVDNKVLGIDINFGDGSTKYFYFPSNSNNTMRILDKVIEHTYNKPGCYDVSLIAYWDLPGGSTQLSHYSQNKYIIVKNKYNPTIFNLLLD